MTITVTGPNGATVDFPDGTAADTIHGVMWQHFGSDAASPPQQPALSDAVTDIPSEIGRVASGNIDAIKGGFAPPGGKGSQGALDSFLSTGKAVAAIPGLIASPLTGAVRSLIGHPLAQAEHAVGTVINPAVAAKDDPQQMYESGADSADTAMMGAMPRGLSPVGIRTASAAVPSSAELKTAARGAYQSPEVTSLKIDPQSTNALSTKIESDLLKSGFRPTPSSAPDTFSVLRNEVRSGPNAGYVEVADLDSARRALQKTGAQRDTVGQFTPDATAAQAAVRHIDDYLANVGPSDVLAGDAAAAAQKLSEARGNYAAYKRSSEIDYRLNKADRGAARSGSGMNIENSMRQKIDQVPDYGLTPSEIAQRDSIVLGTPARNALRTVGKLGVDGGLSLSLNAAAAAASGGASIPVTAAATAARILGQQLTRQQIAELNRSIRARSPLAKAKAAVPIPIPLPGPVAQGIAAGNLASAPSRTFMSGLVPALPAAPYGIDRLRR